MAPVRSESLEAKNTTNSLSGNGASTTGASATAGEGSGTGTAKGNEMNIQHNNLTGEV